MFLRKSVTAISNNAKKLTDSVKYGNIHTFTKQ